MFTMDMPDVPPQYQPVVIAQASQAKDPAKIDRTIGLCRLIQNTNPTGTEVIPDNWGGGVDQAILVQTYFYSVENRKIDREGAIISVLEHPKHGILQATSSGEYEYIPEPGYLGRDQITFLVEMGGYKVKSVNFIKVDGGFAEESYQNKKYCPKGYFWKISTFTDSEGNNFITAVDYQSPTAIASGSVVPDAATLAATLGMNFLGNLAADTSGITLNIADLPAGAIGQTVGSTITLDDNAANHGWFIDTTPADNSEYLPTADANVWQAKAGSAAAGKMDMLSVLLHEYGHVLGIEHSVSPKPMMTT